MRQLLRKLSSVVTMVSSSVETSSKVNVVIVGGGASGLQCASSLLGETEKPSLLILEARDRLGGRVHTVQETRSTVDDGQGSSSQEVVYNRDYGASWVHGTGYKDDEDGRNPIVNLLQEVTPPGKDAVDTHLVPIFPGNPWTRPDTIGNQFPGGTAMYVNGTLLDNDSSTIQGAIRQHFARKKELFALVNRLYEAGRGNEVNTTSVEEMKNRLKIEQCGATTEDSTGDDDVVVVDSALLDFYDFMFANWVGISTSEIPSDEYLVEDAASSSGQVKTDEAYAPAGDYKGPHCKVTPGMGEALRPLISKVDQYVKLGEKVTRIQNRGDDVVVETESGHKVVADCCVCSIPLGCLQTVDVFEPALNAKRMEAIRAISPGAYKKVFLTFDRIFWPKEKALLGLIRANPPLEDNNLGKHLLANNVWARKDIPCFEVILCGDQGKWANHKSDETIQKAVIRFLEDAMGLSDLEQYCVGCHVTRWEEDPFSMGSYSTLRTGSTEDHVELLRTTEWDGRLIFCGEYTEIEHMGAFHAALMSGERASEEAMATLRRS